MDETASFLLNPFIRQGSAVEEASTAYALALRSKNKETIAATRNILVETWVDVAIQNAMLENSMGEWIKEYSYGKFDRKILSAFWEVLDARKNEIAAAERDKNPFGAVYAQYQSALESPKKDLLATTRTALVEALVNLALVSPDAKASFASWLEHHAKEDPKIKTEFDALLRQRRDAQATAAQEPGFTISEPEMDGTPDKGEGAFRV